MSANKNKYFQVTLTNVVYANTQTEALAVVFGEKNASGELMGQEIEVERIPASTARVLSLNV